MTKKIAADKIKQAEALIFEIEASLPLGNTVRRQGYRARVALAEVFNDLNSYQEVELLPQTNLYKPYE